jgi:AraC-like DNA-binding protein
MDYSRCVQNSIAYIEQHLSDELSLDGLARQAGFSKYHFLRIFERQTGSGLWEYIQNRRIAKAARLLLMTELPIIEVGLFYQFDSQEAFTRAFKNVYALPPGKYRKIIRELIQKETNTAMDKEQMIPGWLGTGTAPEKYEYGLDQHNFFKETKSAFLKSRQVKIGDGEFGTVMQQFKAKNYLGKRIRFSGFVKADNVKGWGGLWMRIDSVSANTLKLDNMQNRAVKGSSGWNYYSTVLDVPENSAVISIGILLSGEGKLWLDNARLDLVDKNVPTTDIDISSELPEGPVNLLFEERPIK